MISQRNLLLCVFLIFSLLFVLLWVVLNNYKYGVFSVVMFNFALLSWSRADLSHPCTWCPPFITLYNSSVLILDELGVRSVENHDELLIINLFALFGFFLACLFGDKRSIRGKRFSAVSESANHLLAIKLLVVSFFALSFFVVVNFFASGAVVKSDFNGGLTSFFRILLFYTTCMAIYYSVYKNESTLRVILLFSPFYFISAIALGERDIFFSFALVSIFLLYILGKGNKLFYYCLGFSILMLVPILGEYKNVFTKSEFNDIDYSNYLVVFLDGEFRSAGFNNEVILNSFDGPLFYGKSLVNDLLRAVFPGFILSFENSVAWYNNTYHPGVRALGQGYGFSLAAEGYINFKLLGVLVWFFIYGGLVSILYRMASRNIYFMAGYVCSVPVFIYSLRGDFSTLLSPILKTVMLSYLLLVLVVWFLESFSRKYAR